MPELRINPASYVADIRRENQLSAGVQRSRLTTLEQQVQVLRRIVSVLAETIGEPVRSEVLLLLEEF
jgi:hypothetical protein